jgi:hypothetical protein
MLPIRHAHRRSHRIFGGIPGRGIIHSDHHFVQLADVERILTFAPRSNARAMFVRWKAGMSSPIEAAANDHRKVHITDD